VLVAVDADGGLLGDVTYVPGPGPLAELEEEGDAGIRMLAVSPAPRRDATCRCSGTISGSDGTRPNLRAAGPTARRRDR
jgi:hypothetical protein